LSPASAALQPLQSGKRDALARTARLREPLLQARLCLPQPRARLDVVELLGGGLPDRSREDPSEGLRQAGTAPTTKEGIGGPSCLIRSRSYGVFRSTFWLDPAYGASSSDG
jgi:hypothetical protein